jgi:hypothetical protein
MLGTANRGEWAAADIGGVGINTFLVGSGIVRGKDAVALMSILQLAASSSNVMLSL